MLKIDGMSHKGMKRVQNQDCFLYKAVNDHLGYALVCDGMGGENAGDVASRVACEIIGSHLEKDITQPLSVGSIKNMLSTAISAANVKVYEMAKLDKGLMGMGTTVSLVIAYEEMLYVAHAGDSRAYRVELDGTVTQLTRDHTMVNALVDSGELSEEQAMTHPQRHYITKALGVMPTLEFDYFEEPFPKGSTVLVCSDGLTSYMTKEDLPSLLADYYIDKNPRVFIDFANERGGADNITAVVLSDQ